jgi:hypothetical protein
LTAETLLQVFSTDIEGFALRTLQGALRSAEYPATLGVGIAGEATDAEMEATDWDAAILRWSTPELHEVALIDRELRADSKEAEAIIDSHVEMVANGDDPTGQLIVTDHLRKTRAVYSVQILPAMLVDEDHGAWAALDTVLRCIAAETGGLIWLAGEGYCDSDGELLLAENYDEEDELLDGA